MRVEGRVKTRLDEGFWTGERGMASLEPGLGRFNDAVEFILGKGDFSPDGPFADRHGSYERQFLREAWGEVSDVVTLALTPASEEEIDLSVTPGVMRDNIFATGEAQVRKISAACLRSGSLVPLEPVVEVLRRLCENSSLWRGLANRLPETAIEDVQFDLSEPEPASPADVRSAASEDAT